MVERKPDSAAGVDPARANAILETVLGTTEGRRGRLASERAGWNAGNDLARRDVSRHHRPGADERVGSHRYAAEDDRS